MPGPHDAPPRVEVRRSARRTRTGTAFRERDAVVVVVPARLTAAAERRIVDQLVARVLAREAADAPPASDDGLAARALELAVRHLDARAGVPVRPQEVRWVTNQHRRWGSCTPSTGTIRLSHRLRAMPSWVGDYVLVHELAHLVEPRHDAAFWRLVAGYPHAERARGFLEGYLAAGRRPESAPDDPVPDHASTPPSLDEGEADDVDAG